MTDDFPTYRMAENIKKINATEPYPNDNDIIVCRTVVYNGVMPLNLHEIDPAELAPIPDVPESYGPRNDEDEHVLKLVREGLESGPAIAVDDAFFARLRSRISLKS